jgi:hypothetical protein
MPIIQQAPEEQSNQDVMQQLNQIELIESSKTTKLLHQSPENTSIEDFFFTNPFNTTQNLFGTDNQSSSKDVDILNQAVDSVFNATQTNDPTSLEKLFQNESIFTYQSVLKTNNIPQNDHKSSNEEIFNQAIDYAIDSLTPIEFEQMSNDDQGYQTNESKKNKFAQENNMVCENQMDSNCIEIIKQATNCNLIELLEDSQDFMNFNTVPTNKSNESSNENEEEIEFGMNTSTDTEYSDFSSRTSSPLEVHNLYNKPLSFTENVTNMSIQYSDISCSSGNSDAQLCPPFQLKIPLHNQAST